MTAQLKPANGAAWYVRPRVTRAPERFSHALAQTRETLAQAARYAPCVLSSSLSAEDIVLFHLIHEAGLPIETFALDTGKLPAATLQLWTQTEARYRRALTRVTPDAFELETLYAAQSDSAIYESKAARARCCDARKTAPLRRALVGKGAWVTGLRKAQSPGRGAVPLQSWDSAFGLEKFNPLADWTDQDLWYFVDHANITVSPLYNQGYASIGCEPCTRPIRIHEHPRAGRWWWEAAADTTTGPSTECGIHVATPTPTSTPLPTTTQPDKRA